MVVKANGVGEEANPNNVDEEGKRTAKVKKRKLFWRLEHERIGHSDGSARWLRELQGAPLPATHCSGTGRCAKRKTQSELVATFARTDQELHLYAAFHSLCAISSFRSSTSLRLHVAANHAADDFAIPSFRR